MSRASKLGMSIAYMMEVGMGASRFSIEPYIAWGRKKARRTARRIAIQERRERTALNHLARRKRRHDRRRLRRQVREGLIQLVHPSEMGIQMLRRTSLPVDAVLPPWHPPPRKALARVREMVGFPAGAHDDVVDALAYGLLAPEPGV